MLRPMLNLCCVTSIIHFYNVLLLQEDLSDLPEEKFCFFCEDSFFPCYLSKVFPYWNFFISIVPKGMGAASDPHSLESLLISQTVH